MSNVWFDLTSITPYLNDPNQNGRIVGWSGITRFSVTDFNSGASKSTSMQCSAPSNCSNFNTVNWYAEKKVHDFFDWSSGCICIENHVSFFLLIDVIHTPKNAQVFALHKCLSPLFIWTGFFQSSSLKYQVWWTGFFPSLQIHFVESE